MSTKNLLPSKNRIAPPYQKFYMVLFLFLSSIVFSPLLVQSTTSKNVFLPSSRLFSTQEETLLFQEKFEVISGKGSTLISSFELIGGKITIPFDFSAKIFDSINQVDLIISNQSFYSTIWTNPLWKYPDGLVIRVITRTTNSERLISIFSYINSIVFNSYDINLTLYNFERISQTDYALSFIAPISNEDALPIFTEIFNPYGASEYGNMVSVVDELLQNNPKVFAFGYSIKKNIFGVSNIVRSAIVGSENLLSFSDNQYRFNASNIYGKKLIPNTSASISKFIFRIPYYPNISYVNPIPSNVASELTGTFEWILKYSTFVYYSNFDMEIFYSPQPSSLFTFPRVQISNSYSDFLLENSGILNMTYTAINLGNEPAYNTTIRVPIPPELELFVSQGLELPVLNDFLQIDEGFSSYIYLEVEYSYYNFILPILEINGWYEYIANESLARWMDNTSFFLDEYTTLFCTSGISADLYNSVIARIQPILDDYTIIEIISNPLYFEPLIKSELSLAVDEAYSIILSEFYHNKTIFQFNSSNFDYKTSIYGNYLECIIPYLEINETMEISWQITEIPTSSDVFGAFSISTDFSGTDEYAIFTTKESDYKSLILSLLAQIDSAGRFLSSYEPITDQFISLGSKYVFSDVSGLDYYGLTNGINFQFGDDEAVLVSSLFSTESVYRVGDSVSLTLNITNLGTINAYDIHVNVVNLKLNSYWQPIDLVIVKSFDIDAIGVSEKITREFTIEANSYIGLNSYIALISFTSDKEQLPIEIENPWTGHFIPWIHSGEAYNMVSSTLTFGILLPPIFLQNQARPSFPLPEINTTSNFELSEDDKRITVSYEVENIGLSSADLSVYHILQNDKYTVESAESYISNGNDVTILEPILSTKASFIVVNYSNTTLNPGEKLVINVVFTDLDEDFIIPPLILNYLTLYEIYQTDFQSLITQVSNTVMGSLLKLASANVTENSQNLFSWSSFSQLIKIKLQPNPTNFVTYSPLHWIYPLISTAIIAVAVLIIFVVPKLRRR